MHNAIVHNLPAGGTVWVTTGVGGGDAVLTVENTGRALVRSSVATLAEPFQRGTDRIRTDHAGVGLGLAIVASIAAGARRHAHPRRRGRGRAVRRGAAAGESGQVGYRWSMTTPPQTLGLLVIGSGPAGVHAAAAYVEAGGPGEVCLLSADPDEPYQRPPLSKDVLAGESPAEGTPILEDESALAKVDVRLGTHVESLDTVRRRVRTGDGQELAYERLVLATGSEPTPLPDADAGANVFLLRSLGHGRALADAVADASSAVVVGSGFIGCEAAASLADRGVRTTLVTPERAPQAARLGEWAGERIAEWLEADVSSCGPACTSTASSRQPPCGWTTGPSSRPTLSWPLWG